METRAIDVPVLEAHIHERYDRATYENDIAILRLRRRAAFNTYIMPLCLPEPGLNFEDETGYVAGILLVCRF